MLFRILWVLIAIAYGLLAPLFSGIMQAAFYVEIQNRRAAGSWHPLRPHGPTGPLRRCSLCSRPLPFSPSGPSRPHSPCSPLLPNSLYALSRLLCSLRLPKL
ncbi:MAG: hypothetical protein ACLU3I_08660 [Acutalibacteraceae bacterium]